MKNEIFLVKKLDCHACDVAVRIINSVIDKYKLDIKLKTIYNFELSEDDAEKYDERHKYPAIHFIKDNEIIFSEYGTLPRSTIIADIDIAFDITLNDLNSVKERDESFFVDVNDEVDSVD